MGRFDRLFSIADRHVWGQKNFDFVASPPAVKVLAAVVTVQGIVDNGGFEYLFQNSLPGDPDYTQSLAAFESIDANESYRAFAAVLSLFAPADLVDDGRRRRAWTLLAGAREEEIQQLEKAFWKAKPNAFERLLAYCIANGLE